MKTINSIFALFSFLLLSSSCAVQRQHPSYSQQPSYSQTLQGPVDFQVFYDDLSPYGQWIDNPNYGYVWIPDVNQDFAPYSTDGNWVNTEYGWTWVSNYNWGWAPFHYGRWDYDQYYGWFWVPDNEWGPSWVNWRSGNGYYGWAPMRPGMNINMGYNNDYRDINRWNFVRDRDFGRSNINRYYIDRREYNTIINNSTPINNTTVDRRRNTTYVAGPPIENVQRATGKRINSVTIQDSDRPGQTLNNKQLSIYRPQVERTTDNARRPVPSRVTNAQEIKSNRGGNAVNPRNNVTPKDNTRQRQQTQPVTPQQQPQVTPQQQQNDRRSQETQRPEQPRQVTQPGQPAQQQQVSPQQQQENRRRQYPPQGQPQPQREKVQPVTPPTQQPQVNPQQQQDDRRREAQPQGQRQPQRDNVQPVTPPVQQQQVNPQQQQDDRNRQEQQRQPQRQETQTTPAQQQPQVVPQQPTIQRAVPAQQQRRLERQEVKQQQRNAAPAGNSRRERQQKEKEASQKE